MGGWKLVTGSMTLVLILAAGSSVTRGQGAARGRVEPPRDPLLETTAKHNLDVARWYLTKRKAYQGALDRLQEIADSYPGFSRMDEVLYLMGEAHLKLDNGEKAIYHYNKLIEDFPSSEFVKKARQRLKELRAETEDLVPRSRHI